MRTCWSVLAGFGRSSGEHVGRGHEARAAVPSQEEHLEALSGGAQEDHRGGLANHGHVYHEAGLLEVERHGAHSPTLHGPPPGCIKPMHDSPSSQPEHVVAALAEFMGAAK